MKVHLSYGVLSPLLLCKLAVRTASRQAHWLFQDAQYGGSAHRPQIGNVKSALRQKSGSGGLTENMSGARLSLLDRDQFGELRRDVCHRIFCSTQAASRAEQGADFAESFVRRAMHDGDQQVTC
jgi:hypothetical protein